jgi:hypothetical protein
VNVEVIPHLIELRIPGAGHNGNVMTGLLEARCFAIDPKIEVEVGESDHADVHSVAGEKTNEEDRERPQLKKQPVSDLTVAALLKKNECGDPGVRSTSRNEIFERGGVGR